MYRSIHNFLSFFVILLAIFVGCSKDNPVDPSDPADTLNATGCLIKQGNVEIARADKNGVTGQFSVAERTESATLQFYLLDKSGQHFQPAGEDFVLAWEVKNQMIADVVQYQADGVWTFRLKGFDPGATSVSFKVMNDDFQSLAFPIEVSENTGGGLGK